VTIDQASFEPVYRQLARILREQIQAGHLLPGAALPSEASLSQNFGVGRDAVQRGAPVVSVSPEDDPGEVELFRSSAALRDVSA